MVHITKWLTSLRAFLARRKAPRKPVVLTPLSFHNGKSQVVGILIHDPDTYEIVAQAFDRVTFAEKAGLPRELASEIWDDCCRAPKEAAEERKHAAAEGFPTTEDPSSPEAQGRRGKGTMEGGRWK